MLKRGYSDEKGSLNDVAVVHSVADDNARSLAENDEVLAETYEGDHGTKRALSPRVAGMIALAGTIGTGLFLGSGSALAWGGPVGCFLGYTTMGMGIGGMMYCLGEMMCFAPTIGGFVEMGAKYVNESFGFMMGLSYALKVGLSVPSELSAVALLIGYWDDNTKHAAIYITIFLFITLGCNLISVRWYGEVEFVMGVLKLTTLIGLIIFGLIANLGGIPTHKVFTGGKHWREAPFNTTYLGVKPPSFAGFLGYWAVLTKAAFGFTGIESVALVAGEAHNPRKTLRMCIRTVFYRITGIYIISVIIIGLNIRYNDPELLDANALGGNTAASSPFVLIAKKAGVKVLPHIINAVVITSAWSAGNESLYGHARCLMGMTRNNCGFKCFLWTTRHGVPWVGVCIGAAFGPLAYLTLSDGAAQAFEWLSNLTALVNMVTWVSICFCFVRFKAACEVQGVDRRAFPLRTWAQPYLAWAVIVFFSLIIIFNGFKAFIPVFRYKDFLASYISLPVIAAAWLAWWLYRGRQRFIPLEDIDLSGGPAAALVNTKYVHQALP